jgi:(1->4)-alpha-D-glucan 1-alpha-D-glucosylmutase
VTEPRTPAPEPRRPASTYRFQIEADFDLFEAARRLPYLHELGVDWVYLSPLLAAEPGSRHGYDVVAFDRIDASRGGAAGLAALSAEARRLGMGVLVDVVPNHVGVATPRENAWWWDVLTHGRSSQHAESFDIDWEFGNGRLRIPVLGDDDLPVDGRPTGNLSLVDDELRYHDHRFPTAPGTAYGTPDEVHARQHYELISWRRGDSDLNYRRFFTVSTLAGVRVEIPEVFAAAHVEVRRWFDEGLVDGLRIDHPDGLRDPEGYLDFLAGLTNGAYTVVEKILALRDGRSATSSGTGLVEELPHEWATDGTTGYDALALLDRVLTDPSGEKPLTELDGRLRDGGQDWHQLVHDRKRAVADGSLLAETRRIVRELPDLLPHGHESLEDAVAEVLACFPVYRSYLPGGLANLERALASARSARPDLAPVLDDLAPVLGDAEHPAARRFQQTSGMVMAKGVEDNAFYRTSRLTSLTEVGGEPDIFAVAPAEFHQAMTVRQRDWPHAMTALSTHDTKRGEDTRARIALLSEVPQRWTETLAELLASTPVPDPGFANLLWQTTFGAWPVSTDRLHAYAEKAMREAGERTTWTDPDAEHEASIHAAIDALDSEESVRALVDDLVAELEPAARSNSLALKLLALTMPGVPDVYQGSEVEERSLVDPDNRRPVDYDAAAASLADGSVEKQRLTQASLRLRRDRPELFTGYTPLVAEGPASEHVLAFDRGGAITVVTRLPVGLEAKGGWGETTLQLPEGAWTSLLGSGGLEPFETVAAQPLQEPTYGGAGSSTTLVADLLGDSPVALLVKAAE